MTGIDTDDLYGLPLERFVPERDTLARATRTDGRREEAAAVAKLPKPSVAAWVVNQLVRSQRSALQSVLEAGDALRAAQTAVIDGQGDGHSLRAAAEQERAAVDELLLAAQAVAGANGPALSPTILDRVADTLHAAAFDENARAMVQAGRLTRELRHVGLGGSLAGEGPPPPATRRAEGKAKPAGTTKADVKPRADGKPKADGKPTAETKAAKAAKAAETKAAKAKAADEAREAAKQAEARAEAHRAAKQAEAEAEARRRADRAERALARTQERRDRAAQALEEADEELAGARAESEAAAEAHRQALEELVDSLVI